jgi:Uma2 family endonuclease
MGEVGILSREDRVELIEGQLVAKAPISSLHAGTSIALNHILMQAVGDRAFVSVQNPIRLDDYSEPEPDFALLRPRADYYRRATPGPADVFLLIELSDSSLKYDRSVKRALYARHGIPEFWIVNLIAREVEVCRAPVGEEYTAISRVGAGATLEPACLPGAVIRTAVFFD